MARSLPDPRDLLKTALARDARTLSGEPALAERKRARMSASAFAFLRGSAPFFYDLLHRAPALAEGPPGDGWILGDLHLENFGAYRVAEGDGRKGNAAVLFGPNDFDEAVVAPIRLDVLRLATSTLLAARQRAWSGERAAALAAACIDAHSRALGGRASPPDAPLVTALTARACARSRRELLAARTKGLGDRRRFIRAERYVECATQSLREAATRAFATYATKLDPAQLPGGVDLSPLDVAIRIAGTGSLGVLRIAVLVRGRGGPHGAWIFEMKEQPAPSSAILFGPTRPKGARRVLAAMDALLVAPLHLAGRARVDGRSMLVRRLAPQEDKLTIASVPDAALEGVVAHLADLAGRAHRRGAETAVRAYTRTEREELLQRAIVVAGLHEAAYVAFCRAPGA